MLTLQAISSFLDSCRARGLSPRTIQWYGGILKKFAGEYRILPETPECCESFIKSCKAGDERRHGYFRTLRVFYRYTEKRLGLKNALTMVESPKRQRKLPRPVMLNGLVQLLSFPHPGRIKASLYFLTDTGVRIGELVNLQPADFYDSPWGYLAKVNGKTGQRVIPVSKEAYDAVINFLPFGIKANRMSRLIARAFRDAHVPGTAHCLRHSFGTLWRGTDISLLQRIMGHSNINTTMIYRQVQYDQLAEAHNMYSPLKLVLSQGVDADII